MKPLTGRKQWLVLIVLVLIVLVGLPAILMPWGFFMGGRFHFIPVWQGWGTMHSGRAGGDYILYMWFAPTSGYTMGPRHVSGAGLLCTPRGERFTLSVGGDFEKNMGLDTNGKTARFYMSNNSVRSGFSGNRKPSLELRGKWSNPDLIMDDHGSIARNFETDGRLIDRSANRQYMAEVVPVRVHEGSRSDFEAACKLAQNSRH